jgi:mono/diheme cytochrome c family protein
MKFRITSIILLSLIVFSCNQTEKAISNILNLEALPVVTHKINTEKDTLIELASGLRFKIPAGSIKTDGGEAELQIRVAMEMEDMLKAGLTTMSDGQPMSSAGMFEFEVKNGEIIKAIQVEMPTDRIDEDMQLFKGKRDANGQMNWEDPQDLAQKAPSGLDLFEKNCANCHNVAATQTEETKVPLSYLYQQYDKGWLMNYVRGMTNDAASRCACERWNNQNTDEDLGDSSIDLPFETNEEDFVGQHIGDTTEQLDGSCEGTHHHSIAEPAPPQYSDAELSAIFDYIETKSKELDLPLPTYNAAACRKSCQELQDQYYTAYEKEQALWEASVAAEKSKAEAEKALKKYEMVKVDIILPDTFPDFFALAPPDIDKYKQTKPKKLIASHYKFEIKAEGWYNVDIILIKGNFDECQLDITLSGKHQDRVEVFLVIPSIKVFAQAAKVGATYRVSESGKLSIPIGKLAWVYAIGEENGKVFLAQQAFEIKTSQNIQAEVKKSTKKKQEKALKLMSEDLDLKVDKLSKKDRKAVKKLQKQLAESTASVEKIKEDLKSMQNLKAEILAKMDKPASCACACDLEPNGKLLFLKYCASCHSVDMKRDLTGPALADTEAHWAAFPREELYAFIRNSQGLIVNKEAKAHVYATDQYIKWGSVMTPFPSFSDQEIEAILDFIEEQR